MPTCLYRVEKIDSNGLLAAAGAIERFNRLRRSADSPKTLREHPARRAQVRPFSKVKLLA